MWMEMYRETNVDNLSGKDFPSYNLTFYKNSLGNTSLEVYEPGTGEIFLEFCSGSYHIPKYYTPSRENGQ